MKRKVCKIGPSSLIISLPSKWVKQHGIEKGDEIEVEEKGRNLVIGTAMMDAKDKSIELDISALDRTSIMIAIRSAYRAGYDKTDVRFTQQYVTHYRTGKKVNTLSVIHTEVNRLVGAEIIKEGKSLCIIKDFSANLEQEFEPTIRRIFLLLINVAEDFTKGFQDSDKYLISSIEEKHDTITKFISYCLRIINKGAVRYEQNKHIILYHILSSLDIVTDIYKYAARDFVPKFSKKPSNITIKIISDIGKSIKIYYNLFYKFDNIKSTEFIQTRDKIRKELIEKAKCLSKDEIILLNYMEQVLEIIWELVLARMSLGYPVNMYN